MNEKKLTNGGTAKELEALQPLNGVKLGDVTLEGFQDGGCEEEFQDVLFDIDLSVKKVVLKSQFVLRHQMLCIIVFLGPVNRNLWSCGLRQKFTPICNLEPCKTIANTTSIYCIFAIFLCLCLDEAHWRSRVCEWVGRICTAAAVDHEQNSA